MGTLQEDQEAAARAMQDLLYAVFSALGVIWLTERFGMKPRPWAREARIRALHRR